MPGPVYATFSSQNFDIFMQMLDVWTATKRNVRVIKLPAAESPSVEIRNAFPNVRDGNIGGFCWRVSRKGGGKAARINASPRVTKRANNNHKESVRTHLRQIWKSPRILGGDERLPRCCPWPERARERRAEALISCWSEAAAAAAAGRLQTGDGGEAARWLPGGGAAGGCRKEAGSQTTKR